MTIFTRVLQYTVASVISLILIAPLIWAVSASLHTNENLFVQPYRWVPNPLHFNNYTDAVSNGSLAVSVVNSVIVAGVLSTIGIVLSQMAGYVLGKFRFFGRDVIFWSIVATLMIPFPAIMVPVFVIAKAFGMVDNYAGLIVPALIQASVVFFMRQYLGALPEEFLESARIDGASEWQIYVRIVMPMAWPVLAAMAVLTFTGSWNNLLWPLIITNSPNMFTIPIALTQFQGAYASDNVAILALSVLMSLPTIALFLLVRNRILDSVMVSGGGLK